MKQILQYKHRYWDYWREHPEEWWLARLMQEVGELADTFTGERPDDARPHELRQIASLCMNWLDMRGEWVE